MFDDKESWTVRRCDALAAAAWLVFAIIAATYDVTKARELMPWFAAAVGMSAVLTLIAYLHRHFVRIEIEAFERGVRAGMRGGNIVDMREHEPTF